MTLHVLRTTVEHERRTWRRAWRRWYRVTQYAPRPTTHETCHDDMLSNEGWTPALSYSTRTPTDARLALGEADA